MMAVLAAVGGSLAVVLIVCRIITGQWAWDVLRCSNRHYTRALPVYALPVLPDTHRPFFIMSSRHKCLVFNIMRRSRKAM